MYNVYMLCFYPVKGAFHILRGADEATRNFIENFHMNGTDFVTRLYCLSAVLPSELTRLCNMCNAGNIASALVTLNEDAPDSV